MDEYDLAPEWEDAGWSELDLLDAFEVIEDALDYMDEQGYI